MRNKIIAVVLSVVGVATIGYGAFAVAGDSKSDNPTFTESSCMPSPCKQLLPPAWSPPTTVTTAPKQAESAVTTLPPTPTKVPAPHRATTTARTSITTTSEVPPPLTAEQAANIPPAWMTASEIAWCDNTHQSYESCQFPESQGMGEDTTGTDSDQ